MEQDPRPQVPAEVSGCRAPVRFIDRRTGKVVEEQVYGETFLRWAYGSTSGRMAVFLLAKRPFFSHWYGWQMARPGSRALMRKFVRDYGVDTGECAALDSFESFNDFFCRRLKPGARPVDGAPGRVVFPADGRHLCLPDLAAADGFFVKGQHFDLERFLLDADLADKLRGGALLCSRLCPVDYHRFHFPVAGRAGRSRKIDGPLFSVSPIVLARRLACLWENKRAVSVIESPECGIVAMVEVGATCVGTVRQSYEPGRVVAKGEEKGWFAFGGSCVVTLFQRDRVAFDPDLVANSGRGLETYARMGEGCGTARPAGGGMQEP